MYHFHLLELFSGYHHTNPLSLVGASHFLHTHVFPIDFINFRIGRAVKVQTGAFDLRKKNE